MLIPSRSRLKLPRPHRRHVGLHNQEVIWRRGEEVPQFPELERSFPIPWLSQPRRPRKIPETFQSLPVADFKAFRNFCSEFANASPSRISFPARSPSSSGRHGGDGTGGSWLSRSGNLYPGRIRYDLVLSSKNHGTPAIDSVCSRRWIVLVEHSSSAARAAASHLPRPEIRCRTCMSRASRSHCRTRRSASLLSLWDFFFAIARLEQQRLTALGQRGVHCPVCSILGDCRAWL